MKNKKPLVVIVHGYNDRPDSGWLQWLSDCLQEKGYSVLAPKFPNPRRPKLQSWMEVLDDAVGTAEKDLILVGYSLGTGLIQRYLTDAKPTCRIQGIVLVAGFGRPYLKLLSPLFQEPFNFERIRKRAKTRVCIYSDNDRIVPPKESEYIARQLQAKVMIEPGKGHFLNFRARRGGLKELPSALEAVDYCYENTKPFRRVLRRLRLV